MPFRQDNKILEFTENVPKTITLKTDPAKAKAKEYTSKAGKPYQKWTYITTDGEVFWVFRETHEELLKYRAGDQITITYIVPVGEKYGKYRIEGPDSIATRTTSGVEEMVAETNNLIRILIKRIDAFMSPRNQNVITEETKEEKTDTSLDF
jgi:hypothetical protein